MTRKEPVVMATAANVLGMVGLMLSINYILIIPATLNECDLNQKIIYRKGSTFWANMHQFSQKNSIAMESFLKLVSISTQHQPFIAIRCM